MSSFVRPISSSSSGTSSSALFPLILILLALSSSSEAGTWLSFNQNTGGLDRFSALRGGRSIAEAVGMGGGEMVTEGEQLARLLRMCSERARLLLSSIENKCPWALNRGYTKRASAGGPHNMDELCSALIQMAREEQRRKRTKGGWNPEERRRFVPIGSGGVDEDEQLLWW